MAATSTAAPKADVELKQAFAELQLKMIDSQQKIKFSEMQIEGLRRQMLHKEITNREISGLPTTTPVYESLGRCFIVSNVDRVKANLAVNVKDIAEKIKTFETGKEILEKDYKSHENSVRELVARKKS